MGLSWLVVAPSGAFVARYMRHSAMWLHCHKGAQVVVTSFVVRDDPGAATQPLLTPLQLSLALAAISRGGEFLTRHSKYGLAVAMLTLFQYLLGSYTKYMW